MSWDDWFGRSSEDEYTFRDDTNKAFNWQRGYTNYSNFLMRDSGSVREAAKLVGSMLNVVGIEKNQKMTSELAKAIANTSAERISVLLPSDLLNSEKYKNSSDGDRTDAFLGGSVRSAANHVFNNAGNARDILSARHRLREAPKDTREYGIVERMRDMFVLALADERADRKIAEEFPGYTNFISKYKEFKFKHHYEPQQYKNDYQEFTDVMLRMIQYPGTIEPELLQKFKPQLKQLQEIMDTYGGIPATYAKCKRLGEEIAQYIYRMIVDPPEPENSGGSGEGDGDGKGDGENGGAPPPPLSKEEKEKLLESLKQVTSGNGAAMTTDTDGSDESRTMETILDELTGMGMYDEMEAPERNVIKMIADAKNNYMDVLNRIDKAKASVVGTLLRRKARDFKFSIKSTRSGRLDTNKLVEARMNVPTVYERIGEVKTDKLSVCVLIDESGSMNGVKIRKAQEAAIFLNEALKNQPDIKFFIYGHTADHDETGDTQLLVYREPGHYAPYALGRVNAKSNNRDGSAILLAAKRVRRHTQDPTVMIVISDGYPAATGYRNFEHGCEHTRKAVNQVEARMNMQVIQVAIESIDSSKMFKNYIHLTDMNTFPTEFVGFLRRKMNSMIKEHITM